MAWCDYHPENAAVGVCMRCESQICGSCCTQLDGINHCHKCLADLGRRSTKKREPNSVLASLALIGLLAGAFWLILRLAAGSLF